MNLIVLTKHQIERNYSRERSSLLDGSGGGLLGSGSAGSLLGSGLAGSLLGSLLGGSSLGGAFGGGSFACSDFLGYKKRSDNSFTRRIKLPLYIPQSCQLLLTAHT